MCGIAGYISTDVPVNETLLINMTRSVAHRGPDDEGIYINNRVGFGHRRLSIVDLSTNGHQPMTRLDMGLTIVFNGEIYNYIELKNELIHLGFKFNTATDTEVILVAYAAWGYECVLRFNGMWSFAIHDKNSKQIFCSRDRFGIKPFYYANIANAWVFGSEIRQILPLLPQIKANKQVLEEFLFASYTEPYTETFFEGIKKLPGGHNLIFDLIENRYSIVRYYQISIKPELESVTLDEAVQIYGKQLSNSVTLRLRSDVPVGTCLSGGLDSSSVATLAAQKYQLERGEAFRGITAVSELKSNDESNFAKQIIDYSNLEWITVKPTYDDFVKSLNEVVQAQEEPFSSPSICMQFFVMKTAKNNKIPVLLDGQGGDETLLGYERYYTSHFLHLVKTKGIVYSVDNLMKNWQNNAKMSPTKMIRFLVYFSSQYIRYFNYCYRNRYLHHIPQLPESMAQNAKVIWDIKKLQINEIIYDNLPALLRFEDKNSMWHGIETRLPFLDYQTLETAISLAPELKINQGWTKYVLRKFMDNKMPFDIVWRKNKFGFEAPEHLWLNRHTNMMLEAVLDSKLLQKLCKISQVKNIYRKLDMRTQWRLYSVALWEKEFKVNI